MSLRTVKFNSLLLLGLIFAAGLAWSQLLPVKAATGINQQINYQGKLLDTNSNQVANGSWNFKFEIYDASSGGNLLWTERWTSTTTQVTTVNGVFSAPLGSLNQADALSSVNWNSDSLYLQVSLDADANGSWEESFATRKRFSSASYAFNADMVDGFHATSTAAVASYLPAYDSTKTLNLFTGGVSSTRATTSAFVLIGHDGAITNLDRANGDLYVMGDSEFDGTVYFQGAVVSSNAPTLPHAFGAWATGAANSNVSNSVIYINPASAVTDSNLLGLAVNNSVQFIVDAEGDVFANTLTLAGSQSVGTSNISTLIVENNSYLGDAPNSDWTHIQGSAWIQTNKSNTASSTALVITQQGTGNYLEVSNGATYYNDGTRYFTITNAGVASTTQLFVQNAATSTNYLVVGSSTGSVDNLDYAGGDLYVQDGLEIDGQLFGTTGRLSVLNATTTNIGTLLTYTGATLNGLTTATDLRPSTLNATTTNVGTLTAFGTGNIFTNDVRMGTINATSTNVGTFLVYTGSTLNGLTTATDLRPSMINATTTNIGSLLVYNDARIANLNATTTNVGTLTAYGTGNIFTNDVRINTLNASTTNISTLNLFSELRTPLIHASSTDFDLLNVYGNATTTGWFNIGTTDVVGTLGSLIGAGDLFVGSDATITNGLIVDAGTLFVDAQSNRVGINVTNPSYTLDVGGFVNVDQYSGYKLAGDTILVASSTNSGTFVGIGAGNAMTNTGLYNTAVGYQALASVTTADFNSALGYQALYANTTGVDNTALGYLALRSNLGGANNTAVGHQALYLNDSGSDNTALGFQSLYSNTSGTKNLGLGEKALFANGAGANNTAAGYFTLYNNVSGSNNTAYGYYALQGNTVSNNTAFGYKAGYGGTDDSNYNSVLDTSMTFLGYQASRNNTVATTTVLTNSMALGNGAMVDASNQVVIGNDSILTTLLKGNVGIGDTSPLALLTVGTNDAFRIDASGNASTTGNLSVGTANPVATLGSLFGAGDLFVSRNATTTGNLSVGGFASTTNLILANGASNLTTYYDLYVSGGELYYDGTQLTGGGGLTQSAWKATSTDKIGTTLLGTRPYLTPTSSSSLYLSSDLVVDDNLNVYGNATTSGWFNIGTSNVVSLLGTKIGAGDLFVGRNSTTTGNLTVASSTAMTTGPGPSLFVDAYNSRVGVGTASPGTKLEVYDATVLTATDNLGLIRVQEASSLTGSNAGAKFGLEFYLPGTQTAGVYGVNEGSGLLGLAFRTWGVTQGERLRISSEGNVGIGDTSPLALLTVGTNDAFRIDASGNASTTGNLSVGTTNPVATLGSLFGAGDLFVSRNATTTGNLSVGGFASTTNLILANGQSNVATHYDLYVSGGELYYDGTQLTGGGGLTQSAWKATSTDKIGTTLQGTRPYLTPTSSSSLYLSKDLVVDDNLNVYGNATTSGWFNIGTTDVVSTLGSTIGAGDFFVGADATITNGLIVDAGTLFVDAQGDRVGIGTTAPTEQLTVGGSDTGTFALRSATDPTNYYFKITNSYSASKPWYINGYYGHEYLAATGLDLVLQGANGNVGIGDATPLALLTVGTNDAFRVDSSGNASTTGNFSIGSTNAVATLGSLFGAGDLFVSRNATTSGDLTISGGDLNPNGTGLTIGGRVTTTNDFMVISSGDAYGYIASSALSKKAYLKFGEAFPTNIEYGYVGFEGAGNDMYLYNRFNDPEADLFLGTADATRITIKGSGGVNIAGDTKISANASTTGWFSIGTTNPITTLGSLIGAGDLFVGSDATITNGLIVDGGTLFIDAQKNRIGMGTTTPSTLIDASSDGVLDISGAGQPQITLHDTASPQETNYLTDGAGLYLSVGGATSAANNDIIFRTGRTDASYAMTEAMRINNDGNVGIGDTSPLALLTVGSGDPFRVDASGNASTTGFFSIGATNPVATLGSLFGAGDLFVSDDATITDSLTVDGGTLFVDQTTGRVAIGATVGTTTNIDDKLTIIGGGVNIQGAYSTASGIPQAVSIGVVSSQGTIVSADWGSAYKDLVLQADDLIIQNGISSLGEKMRVTDAGNVGIGDASPLALLTVGTNDAFRVDSSGNASTTGNFSVGTTNPVATLGSLFGAGDLFVSRNATTTGNLTVSTSTLTVFNGSSRETNRIGIGNTEATSTLQVLGSVNFTNSAISSGFYFDNVNNRVGIGTTAPANTLHVYGSAAVYNVANATTTLQVNSTTGYVGINTNVPDAPLDIRVNTAPNANKGALQIMGAYESTGRTALKIYTSVNDAAGIRMMDVSNVTRFGLYYSGNVATILQDQNLTNTSGTVSQLGFTNTYAPNAANTGFVSAYDFKPTLTAGASNSGGDYNAMRVNLTESATTGISTINLLRLDVGGITKFQVDDAGNSSTTGSFVVGTAKGALAIGAGDLFVSDDATVTSALDVGGLVRVDTSSANNLVDINSDATGDYNQAVNITHADNASEDNTALYITNTAGEGSLSTLTTTRNLRSIYNSLTPVVTISGGADANIYGFDQAISVSSLGFGNSPGFGSTDIMKVYGSNLAITGNITYNDLSDNKAQPLSIYGTNVDISSDLTITSISASQANTADIYGGRFANAQTSPGDVDLTATAYGVYGDATGALTTTGGTAHYGGYFVASGSADNNYGIYANGSGATTANYSGYFNSGSFYVGGDTSIVGGVAISSSAVTNATDGLLQVCNGACGTANWATAAGEIYVEGDLETDGHFDVAGNATVTTRFIVGSTNPTGAIGAGDLFVGSDATVTNGLIVDAGTLFVDAQGNRVGVGVTAPAYTFDVLRTSTDGLVNYVANFFNDGNDKDYYGLRVQAGVDTTASNSGLTIYLDAFDGDGTNVGYLADNNQTFGVTDISDARLKTNITDTAIDGLAVINGLRVADFNRIGAPDAPKITGFIAQEVQQVYPHMVSIGADGYLGVVKDDLVPVIVKALQQQQAQIDLLQSSATASTTEPLQVITNPDIGVQTLVVQQAATFYGTMYVMGEAGFEHKVVFKDDVEIEGKLYVSADQAGTIIIPAGATSTEVVFSKPFNTVPKINVTPLGRVGTEFWISDKTSSGFRLNLDHQVNQNDVSFDWLALGLNGDGAPPAITDLVVSNQTVGVGIPVELWAKVTDPDTSEQDLTYTWSFSPEIGSLSGTSGLVYWTVDSLETNTPVVVTVHVSDGKNVVDKSTTIQVLGSGQVAGAETTEPTPEPTPTVVLGCTDQTADNYNTTATTDDGSCIYPTSEPTPVVEQPATLPSEPPPGPVVENPPDNGQGGLEVTTSAP